MSRKLSYKQPYSNAIMQGLNRVSKKYKIAENHRKILSEINDIHKKIINKQWLLKKDPMI